MSQSSPANDEISLQSIKDILISILLSIFFVINTSFLFLRKYFIIILVCLILGGGLGYLYDWLMPKEYSLSMVVQHTELTKRTYGESFDQLNRLARSGSDEALGKELSLSTQDAAKIISFDARNMSDEPLLLDTSRSKSLPFIIIAKVKDNSIASGLESGLLKYFNSNSYVSKIKEGKKQVYMDKLRAIDNELKKLDTLKDQYNKFLANSNNAAMFYNNAFNPAEIYLRSSDYLTQKEGLLIWLNEDYLPLNLIEGFKPVMKPVNGNAGRKVIVGLIIGVLTGITLAGFIALDSFQKARKPGIVK